MDFLRALSRGAVPKRYWCAAALALVVAAPASAEICKYIDADGNIHYSNVPPDKGFRRLSCTLGDESAPKKAPAAPPAANANAGAGSAPARPATPASAPAGFPRVDAETQKGRDDVRRKVLGDELSAEEKLLAEARTAYADGAPQPLPEERNDAEKYRQRIARLRESVLLHEKNIEAIRKEIAAMR
jgi:hypothetical protein